ncbi:MAG: hypothetical protein WCX69_05850 [Candidatus Paceibacterota bacterium]
MEKNGGRCKKCKLGIIAAAAVFLILVGIAVLLILGHYYDLTKAQANPEKLKNFRENKYGFLMDYPFGWSLDVSYDYYAKGLMNADLNNKKCESKAKQCNADCADIRILAGKKPLAGEGLGLLSQLYEDFMMVRDFSGTSALVTVLEINSKKVFKVDDDALTLTLNGICPGPLYVFETDSGCFVYIFAGYGAKAAADNSGTIEKIISSINIK